jgi:hypothetical protein
MTPCSISSTSGPLNGISAKLSYFLASQHNEYKLFFLHGVAWLHSISSGTSTFGYSPPSAMYSFSSWHPALEDVSAQLQRPCHPPHLFIPVSWLLFQLQYWENLDWAAPGLQHLVVLPFSLGAIYLLVRGKSRCGHFAVR